MLVPLGRVPGAGVSGWWSCRRCVGVGLGLEAGGVVGMAGGLAVVAWMWAGV
jgi:hypothetical protein